MSAPANNMITFSPGTVIQSAQVNQDINDAVMLSGGSVGSQLQVLLSSNFSNYVQSGGIITTASGLTVNMSAAYIVVSGLTYYMPAQSFTVQASKDTYIDFQAGSVATYNATAGSNNAASPSLNGSVRMGIIVSGASTITANNQGQTNATVPVASSSIYSVVDSLGNLIYPYFPNLPGKQVGYRQLTSGFSTASTTPVYATGASTPVIITNPNQRLKITIFTYDLVNGTTTKVSGIQVYRGTSQGALTTEVQAWAGYTSTASPFFASGGMAVAHDTPGVGTWFYTFAVSSDSGGGTTTTAGATGSTPLFVSVELE